IDEKTILIGHSSGCEAIMRLLEKDKVRGVILVAACHTDLEWIVQLHSPSDHLILVAEGRFVADKLQSEYMELEKRGHFMEHQLPEVLKVIKQKCHV
ncbi:unnamed protein product, partial [Adineta steineri]